MKLKNTTKDVEIIISDKLFSKISTYGIDQYPNEFGGFLIGYYSNDFKTLTISETILPKVYKGSPSLFQRSVEGIQKDFEEAYKKTPHQYYVGEWHTHPNGSIHYSNTDLKAMISIEQCKTVHIKNPILLIISTNKESINNFKFYLYENKKLFPFI
ncbi:Mov34/MPN/PAD-1 family protein [Tenacibaculum ovolyticum]|uniref:Mov34/MPN/PAD-1 family protein n=1 Tax=Tenacibaculum ovolyticum TaxID=104270 RepID=UPI0003FC38E3|nr:Mov34/MPN/PAD-1 family protein [Tenacibaculum ovolyticum]